MSRTAWSYVLVLAVFAAGLALILNIGERLPNDSTLGISTATTPASESTAVENILSEFSKNLRHPLSVLLLQAVVIILFAKLCARLLQRARQPRVIGEILAGILLGPSALGMLSPGTTAFLFPPASLPNLQFISLVGLILFMFIVGMEVDLAFIRKRIKTAIVVSHVSVVFPFLLGSALALFLFQRYAPAQVGFTAFALFMGIAMSITAFPVLARILQERKLSNTALGTMAITCAAVDDLTAWCILAAVVGVVRAGTLYTAIPLIALTALYIAIMLAGVRPLLRRWLDHVSSAEQVSTGIMSAVFLLLLTSAFITEAIGIHALFGAFLAGVVMPAHPRFRQTVIDRLEHLSAIVLLPLFFAFTGLRTEIGLLDDWESWLICAAIIAVATLGKLGGTMLAARWTGMNWRNAAALGVLMNTRGLMELVVLNIGYDLGILSAKMFTMMVIMALVTTVMTGPLLDWLQVKKRSKQTLTT